MRKMIGRVEPSSTRRTWSSGPLSRTKIGVTMKVQELVTLLQALSDQDAIVVIGEGSEKDAWLLVTGVVERRIKPINSDVAGPGKEPAIEIV